MFLTRATCLPLDIEAYAAALEWVGTRLSAQLGGSYSTTCIDCLQSAETTHFVWIRQATCSNCGATFPRDESTRRGGYFYCPVCTSRTDPRSVASPRLDRILYRCPCRSGDRRAKQKAPDTDDLALAANPPAIASLRPELATPLTPNARHDVFPGMTVSDLFTVRAQFVLSALRTLIDQAPCSDSVRDCLILAFVSSLPQSSRLHSIDYRPNRVLGSRGWTVPSYWIASGHFELTHS